MLEKRPEKMASILPCFVLKKNASRGLLLFIVLVGEPSACYDVVPAPPVHPSSSLSHTEDTEARG